MQTLFDIYGHQLGRPHGRLGSWFMQHILLHGNAALNRWSIDALDLQPGQRVLEIGCGPGAGLQQAATQLKGGYALGIDYSLPMLKQSAQRNAARMNDQRVHLSYADAAAIPCQSDVFDAAYAVNVIYFWPDVMAVLGEIRRVLKPGGRILIAIRPDSVVRQLRFPEIGFRSFTNDQLLATLEEAQFHEVHLATQPPVMGLPGVYGMATK